MTGVRKTHNDRHEEGTAAMIEKFTIATVAEQSKDFRRVLWTGKDSQLVIMTIPPGGEIGEETINLIYVNYNNLSCLS